MKNKSEQNEPFYLQGTYSVVWKRRLAQKHIAHVCTHREKTKL